MGHFRSQRWTKSAQDFDGQLGLPSGALFPSRPALRISSYRAPWHHACARQSGGRNAAYANRIVSENRGEGNEINARLRQSSRKRMPEIVEHEFQGHALFRRLRTQPVVRAI